MAITPITITAPSINTVEFHDLTNEILNNLVHGDASPFKEAKTLLEDYLAGATDLDPTQKAGIFSSFLQNSYGQINQQAISGAIDILKTNEQLFLETYAAENAYNNGLANIAKTEADILLTETQKSQIEAQTLLVKEQVLSERANWLEGEAKLHKQWGYDLATVGNLTTVAAELKTQTDGYFGSIDKQIIGYDKVNYKDVMKSTNENIALLSNAGAEVGAWQIDIIKNAVEMITDGKIQIYTDYGDLGVNDTETRATYSATGVVDGVDVGTTPVGQI